MNGQLQTMATAIGGRLHGADVAFDTISTDSRHLASGQLFVALSGEQFDGHKYLSQAAAAGAAGAVVERPDKTVALPQIQVADCRRALGLLAQHWRRQHRVLVAAITGSNGKTTVKQMLAAILQAHFEQVLVTHGNFNNDIGVPLTLFGLQAQHQAAVVEMGANHPGEIGWLCSLAQPDVALITNAGQAHLEGFGDLRGVATSKGELFASLPPTGVAIINADDCYAGLWQQQANLRAQVLVGHGQGADYQVAALGVGGAGQRFELRYEGVMQQQVLAIELPLLGQHNRMNAAMAAVAALKMGAATQAVQNGLASMQPVAGRLIPVRAACGATVIDDSYNANPTSMAAGIHTVVELAEQPWVALGDMAELGEHTESQHRQMGELAKELGVKRLFALGPNSQLAVQAFGAGGEHFTDMSALIERVSAELNQNIVLLVKGSRTQAMERLVQALAATEGNH